MNKESVIVYSHDQCEKSKLLKNQLDAWGIEFVEKDVKENPEHLKNLQDQGILRHPRYLFKIPTFKDFNSIELKKN